MADYTDPSAKEYAIRRFGLIGLLVIVAATGCGTIVVLSGPRTVAAGDTVTYVLGLGGADNYNTDLYVGCDVPSSWELLSNSYMGTASGIPISGSAIVTNYPWVSETPPPGDGNQRIWLSDGPFDFDVGDTGELTVTFHAVDIPPGEFVLKFWFICASDPATRVRPFTAVVVNHEPRWYDFIGAFFLPDGALAEGRATATSPDGKTVVLGGWGAPNPILSVYDRDPFTGELSYNHSLDGNPDILLLDHIAFAPESDHLYGFGPTFLALYRRDPATGRLSFAQVTEDGFYNGSAWHDSRKIAFSPDGTHLYLAAADDGSVTIFGRDPGTGLVTYLSNFWDQMLREPAAAAVSPDGANVYAVGGDSDSLMALDREETTGGLLFRQVFQNLVGGIDSLETPTDVIVSVDGRHVYTAGYYSDAVTIFERDLGTGDLIHLGAIKEGLGDVVGIRAPVGLVLSPDDRTLFVSARQSLAVFERDPVSGALSLLQVDFDGEAGVTGILDPTRPSISPDGLQLFHPDAGAVAVFSKEQLFADDFEAGDTDAWSVTSSLSPGFD